MASLPAADFALVEACEQKGIAHAQRWQTALPPSPIPDIAESMAAYRLVTANEQYEFGCDFSADIYIDQVFDTEIAHIRQVTGCSKRALEYDELKPAKLFELNARPKASPVVWTASNAEIGVLIVAEIWKEENTPGVLQVSELVWQL